MKQLPRSLLQLPQRKESWCLAVRKLRVWITPPDEAPSRPYGIFAVNLNHGYIQGFEIIPFSQTRIRLSKLFQKFFRINLKICRTVLIVLRTFT